MGHLVALIEYVSSQSFCIINNKANIIITHCYMYNESNKIHPLVGVNEVQLLVIGLA